MQPNPFIAICSLVLLLSFSSCKKSDAPQKEDHTSFPLNTDWTGSMHQTAEQYYEPCYLRINKDKTIKIYGFFHYYNAGNNSTEQQDSLSGIIKSIDTANGKMSVVINISGYPPAAGDQTLTITDKNSLHCNGVFSPFALFLNKFSNKKVSVEGKWSGPLITRAPYDGHYAYPDLHDIVFNADGTTTYWRGGNLAYQGVPQASDYYIITALYKQAGPVVWMDGYNETKQKLVEYFGVIIGGGDSMLVTARDFINGRLPSKIGGSYQEGPYGTSGYTPYIIRK